MKTFVLRLNPDTRKGKPYSAYPTAAEYEAIHASSPMDGFHEAINFLPEGGVVRGYLPPKHSSALRTGDPFALVTITAKTAKTGADQLMGFQVGCVYEGEHARTTAPRVSRTLGLLWHFSCPSSMSLLLSTPLAGAREVVVGKDSGWLRGPTIEIPRKRFLQCLDAAGKAAATKSDVSAIDRLRTAFLEGLPAPEVSPLDNESFEDAVAEAYRQPGTAPTGNRTPKQVRTTSYQFVRDPAVVAHALRVANGVCGDCHKPAPFNSRRTGLPYLEVHHKKTLAAGGEDTIENVLALCPNCHRKRHHGENDA
ncbi:MAG: HNH endonuclease [Xanthomonadales bacterium]|nr:HNH endonuclease [Xanthomonadales bacterium]